MNTPPKTPEGTVNTPEELALLATELTDGEVKMVGKIWTDLVLKYGLRRNTIDNLEELRDEAYTTFAEHDILVTLDPAPCFYGEPPAIEIIGHVSGHEIRKHGFDHERKQWEVLKSIERGEDYYGQIEPTTTKKGK